MPSKICGSEPLVFCVWVDRWGYVRKGEKNHNTPPQLPFPAEEFEIVHIY